MLSRSKILRYFRRLHAVPQVVAAERSFCVREFYSAPNNINTPRYGSKCIGCTTFRRNFSSADSLPDHTVVPMPALSPTMESGSISKWNLKEGDRIDVGASICEVETDKATVSFDATDEGFIAKILVSEGGEVKVGDPILVTVEEEEHAAAFTDFIAPAAAPATPQKTAPSQQPSSPPVSAASVSTPLAASVSSDSGDRIFASPLARKLTRESGLTLNQVVSNLTAAGELKAGKRIVAADVLRAASLPQLSTVASSSHSHGTVSPKPTANLSFTAHSGVFADFELSNAAKLLAERQTFAKQTVPHYYLSVELNIKELLKLRNQFNESNREQDLSVQDFMVKAAALAMKQVPDVNGAWMDSFIRRYHQVDINLVMGTGSFVATPLLRDVGSKGLASIAAEAAAFEDSLFSDEGETLDSEAMALGTFSIHNLGIYGVKSAAPIVLTPQACALSLGAVVDSVIPADNDSEECWEVAPIVTATLSCDHRVVDGAVGAQWLAAFKTFVENPTSMLL